MTKRSPDSTRVEGGAGVFLDRHGQQRLRAALLDVEGHLDDLTDAICRQSVRSRKDTTAHRRRRKLDGRAPHDEGAQLVADGLHGALSTAIRHATEERGLPYPSGCRSMVGMCVWLRRNMIAFAMSEGSTEWADDIVAWSWRVVQVVDLPPDDYVHIDPAQVKRANAQVVTLGTIDVVARWLGDLGVGLNARRLRTLAAREQVRPDGEDAATGTKFYRLGDVLDAHHRHPRRRSAS